MPLSSGILLGLAVSVTGAVLFFVTEHKKASKVVFGFGALLTTATVAVIVLAANSNM